TCVNLNKIDDYALGLKLLLCGRKIRGARRVDTVRQGNESPSTAKFFCGFVAEDLIGDSYQRVVVWCSVAGFNRIKSRSQGFPVVGKRAHDVRDRERGFTRSI